MKKLAVLFIINSILFLSCNEPQTARESGNTDSLNTQIPLNEQPVVATDSTGGTDIAAPAPQAVVTSAGTATGLNPAHGEPGHRCEIAVGAPLNSAPVAQPAAAQPAPATVTVPQPVPAIQAVPAPQPSASKVVTSPRMNPPHGEPGHDCAIKVGEPLKKK